jgi:hypothetical protein
LPFNSSVREASTTIRVVRERDGVENGAAQVGTGYKV